MLEVVHKTPWEGRIETRISTLNETVTVQYVRLPTCKDEYEEYETGMVLFYTDPIGETRVFPLPSMFQLGVHVLTRVDSRQNL